MIKVRIKRAGYSYKRKGKTVKVPSHNVTYKKNLVRGVPKKIQKLRVFKTMYIQDPISGRMIGRKFVKGKGDRTGILFDPSTGRLFGKTKKYST